MKNATASISLVILTAFPLVGSAQNADYSISCWDSVRAVSTDLSKDQSCVVSSSKDAFSKLCSANGAAKTKEFNAYLVLRERYESAQADAANWLNQHPGASELDRVIATKLQNASNAFMVAGHQAEIEDSIESLRRSSSNCK